MIVRNDHRSKFSNLSNWKEKAWKNQGFNGIRTRDLRYRGGHGFESCWSPDFFRLLLSNCLNWKIYCDDHSSLSYTTAVHIWIISYKLHITSWKMGEWKPVFKKGDRRGAKKPSPYHFLYSSWQDIWTVIKSPGDMPLWQNSTPKWQRTGRNLLGLMDDRKLAVGTKQLLYVLPTDMSKAFDCLSHSLTIKISWGLILWLWKWISWLDAIVFQKQKKYSKTGRNYKWLEKDGTWMSSSIILRALHFLFPFIYVL